MVKILINFQLNALKEEQEKLFIDKEAELEFLGEGFANCIYEGKIQYGVYSRYWDPENINILIDVADKLKTIIEWGMIFRSLRKYLKKQKGYRENVEVKYDYDKYLAINIYENDEEIVQKINETIKNEKLTNKKIVERFIESKRNFFCDDCLSEELSIYPRQNINTLVRKLVKEQGYHREKMECDRCKKVKLITYKF